MSVVEFLMFKILGSRASPKMVRLTYRGRHPTLGKVSISLSSVRKLAYHTELKTQTCNEKNNMVLAQMRWLN
jgi:hypothetical protein